MKKTENNDLVGWNEVEDPEFFKFEKIGDKLEGKLIDVGQSDQYKFGLYTLEKEDGGIMRFHGSAQLDTRMKRVKLYDYIRVEFMDLERRAKGDMKLFSVKVRQ